ncbi:NAD-dependent epimerase/dehydratase family protein [Myxococcota bacterium]|nr:NAD-dependent epimerase/dehydratase family protein [Myxococcota bacterium]
MRIAITGISGRFGRLLARRLHRRHAVVGIDRRPYHERPADVELHQIDIRRQRCEDIFRAGGFDAVVHLNVMHDPRASSEDHHTFNIRGTTRVMEYCVRYAIPKLVLLSSANVYGPRAENPQFLTEDAPLMGGTRFGEIRDLIALDMCAQSFFWKHPDVATVILRPVHIVGAVRNAPSNYLRLEHIPRLAGFDPMLQIIHEADVADAIAAALEPGVRGVYNVAGCAPVPLSVLLRMTGRPTIDFPHFLAEAAVERLWRLRLTSFPAPEVDHLRYVCMVDDAPFRAATGFRAVNDLDATMAHLRLTSAADLR